MPTITKERPATEGNTSGRIIREPAFAKRLESACDGNPHCPVKHKGRGSWIVEQFKQRYKEPMAPETVRKWFYGETKPRPKTMVRLAEILQVDAVWLQMGVDPDLTPRERKVRNAIADGVVNVVAGFIQMDGGHPSFPDEKNRDSRRNHVDIQAIIRGAHYDFHVALADEHGNFHVPTTYENVVVLGVVRSDFGVKIYEVTPEVIEEHGHRRGGSIEISGDVAGLRPIKSFTNRL